MDSGVQKAVLLKIFKISEEFQAMSSNLGNNTKLFK
jgi:hypothetical protein